MHPGIVCLLAGSAAPVPGSKTMYMSYFTVKSLKGLYNKAGYNPDIIRNTGWLFADKFLRMGLNFVLTAWIARYLGAEVFGIWNYAIAFTTLFGVFSTLGLYSIFIRDIVNQPENKNALLGSAFLIKFFGGLVTVLGACVCIVISRPGGALLQQVVFFTATGYVIQSLDVIDFYFQSQVKARRTVLARTIAFGVSGALKVFLVLNHYPLLYFVWANLLELAIAAGCLAVLYNQREGHLREWSFNRGVFVSLFRASAPILLSEIAIVIYMRLDQVMIGDLIGEAAVGEYSAAVRLSEIWYLFANIICSSVFPSIIQARKVSWPLYIDKVQRLFDVMLWVSLAAAATVTLLSDFIIGLFYGAAYAGAAPVLTVHVWTGVFVFFGIASGQYLVVENYTKISFYRTLFGLVTNVALNFMLIPTLGTVGAAWATLTSQAFSALISNLFFRQTRNLFFMYLKSANLFRFVNR